MVCDYLVCDIYSQHGSQYGSNLTECMPPAGEVELVVAREKNKDSGHVLPPHTPPTSDNESAEAKASAPESRVESGPYSSKIEGMSKSEISDEVEWQMWKFKNDIKKVGSLSV